MRLGNRHEATAGRKGAKLSLFGFVLLSLCCSAAAQQPTRVSRIGYLDGGFASTNAARINGFRQGLRDLGYIEGKNIIIEYRHSEGRRDRIAELSAELVRLKVDVIVAGGGGAAIDAAKQATKTIPIVMPMAIDPVEQGFVTSLARPGGNVTGLATLAPEISGKQLDILREIVPKLSHVGVLDTSTNSANARLLKEVELAAQALHLKIQYLDVKTPVEFESAFRSAGNGHAEAMLVLTGPIVNAQRKEIADLAAKKRLPAIFPFPEYVEAGGLMSYGASVSDSYRRAATYVDKILEGAKPIDLPVEQPAKFEFIVNLKAAKQIDLMIPLKVLARADRVSK